MVRSLVPLSVTPFGIAPDEFSCFGPVVVPAYLRAIVMLEELHPAVFAGLSAYMSSTSTTYTASRS